MKACTSTDSLSGCPKKSKLQKQVQAVQSACSSLSDPCSTSTCLEAWKASSLISCSLKATSTVLGWSKLVSDQAEQLYTKLQRCDATGSSDKTGNSNKTSD